VSLQALARWARLREDARQTGDSSLDTFTLAGRRCRGIAQSEYTLKLNAPIQGLGADILKLAMVNLWEDRERFPNAFPILAVHDELIYECPAEQAAAVGTWIAGHMQAAAEQWLPNVPVPVIAELLATWGQALDPDEIPALTVFDDDEEVPE